jgi:hypothetical protein
MNFNFKDEDLTNLFTSYGNVGSAKIIIDRETGRSKGFGFVEMANDDEALRAIEALHQSEVMGRKLVVNQARPQEKKQDGGYGSGNRFGGGRGPRNGEGRN